MILPIGIIASLPRSAVIVGIMNLCLVRDLSGGGGDGRKLTVERVRK